MWILEIREEEANIRHEFFRQNLPRNLCGYTLWRDPGRGGVSASCSVQMCDRIPQKRHRKSDSTRLRTDLVHTVHGGFIQLQASPEICRAQLRKLTTKVEYTCVDLFLCMYLCM